MFGDRAGARCTASGPAVHCYRTDTQTSLHSTASSALVTCLRRRQRPVVAAATDWSAESFLVVHNPVAGCRGEDLGHAELERQVNVSVGADNRSANTEINVIRLERLLAECYVTSPENRDNVVVGPSGCRFR